MGNDQQREGMLDKAEGNVKEGLGKVTGNEQMEYEGKFQQGEGQIKEGVGNAREDLERTADEWNRDRDRD